MKFSIHPIVYCLLPARLHLWLLMAGGFIVYCLSSCNPTKKLGDGEFLLHKNSIAGKSGEINKSDMEAYIKQKSNRRILFWRFYLHVYNNINQDKIEKRKIRRNARVEFINSQRMEKNNQLNLKREAKGKKSQKVVLKKQKIWRLREWFLSIGEPPVIYDSLLSKKSARQINLFLNNKGFFNSVVKDSISIKRKKASVHYMVYTGKPYTFRNIIYEIKDAQLNYYVLADASASHIKRGRQYEVELLQKERDRITNMLRNDGYFLFSKEYIYFEVDSSLGTHELDITIGIKNPVIKTAGEKDTTIEIDHKRFYINNIYVYTDYDPSQKTSPKDTLISNDYYLLSAGYMRYKPRLITDAVFISKGELFQQQHSDQTFRRLSELKLFRTIQLQFTDVGNDKIDCQIYLSNIPKQSFSAETEGTNTSGTLGIAGSLIYQNKNTFKGGEIFEMKLKGAMEVQASKSKAAHPIVIGADTLPFNTLELGSEVNLSIPRFVTPFHLKDTKSNNAKTNLSGTYNYQRRPDFGRSIANTSYGYSWNETATKRHIINPIEFNLVNIFKPSPDLKNTIDNSTDLFLKNSYSDHFTLGSRYAFVFSNQDIRKQKSFSYLRFGAEAAGNMMRWIFKLIDEYGSAMPYYGGSFMVDSIPFSQYLRSDVDYRYYKILNETDNLVYRIAFGVGKPLHNLRVLPLEKSFFGGGPNSVRAWQARTLGPGSYIDTSGSNFADKIGDAKIEGNFEYRFNVIKVINAALFVDAGNIWLRKPYESYPGGEFTDKNGKLIPVRILVEQIAIDAGMGIRLDFNFFIIRLDGAFKVRDPARKTDDRWMLGKELETVLNFGIGYPF